MVAGPLQTCSQTGPQGQDAQEEHPGLGPEEAREAVGAFAASDCSVCLHVGLTESQFPCDNSVKIWLTFMLMTHQPNGVACAFSFTGVCSLFWNSYVLFSQTQTSTF